MRAVPGAELGRAKKVQGNRFELSWAQTLGPRGRDGYFLVSAVIVRLHVIMRRPFCLSGPVIARFVGATPSDTF